MNLTRKDEKVRRCLNCGKVIVNGRPDKLFCCVRCKNAWHNAKQWMQKNRKEKVISRLLKNYEILTTLIRLNKDSIEFPDLIEMGYNPDYVTGYRKQGRKSVCSCFEIRYFQTPSRISGLRKGGILSEEEPPYGKKK
ncbi:MAG: hypothetical protein IJM41_07075 [Bacteroidales bacterium]|nr:hypothetical protein [Bacteroidales bacterium]MBQ9888988.1 hypothetical protein [Bacteroidales bacterium]